jgi:hypothetical protein
VKRSPMAFLVLQYMDKLDDSRRKRLEEMLSAARSGGAPPAQAAQPPSSSVRASQVRFLYHSLSLRLYTHMHDTVQTVKQRREVCFANAVRC